MDSKSARVCVVDLNNFARYPTVSVGILVATCRRAGFDVSVFSPLAIGVGGSVRERPVKPWTLALAKASYRLAASRRMWVRSLRNKVAVWRQSQLKRQEGGVLSAFEKFVKEARPQVVLISTYLMYRDLAEAMCRTCQAIGVPVVVGGPYFAHADVAAAWVNIPGLTALVAGEVEMDLPGIIEDVIAGAGNRRTWPGVLLPAGVNKFSGAVAPPLKDLDRVGFPDYSDFPWDKYPERIVPVITGRGCSWGACTFCSDVTSSAGRTFRSRSPGNVMEEIRHQYETTGARMFVFTDLKLNGNLAVWHAVLESMQTVAPGATWIAAVHVQEGSANGLSADELRAAAAAGCVRLSTGLESGSQTVLDRMRKGTRIEAVGKYLREATESGISTRCTMITGYPEESTADVVTTTSFLRQHSEWIERISLNRLVVIPGTALHKRLHRDPESVPGLEILREESAAASVEHQLERAREPGYRGAVMRLIETVHGINKKPLNARARSFDGVM